MHSEFLIFKLGNEEYGVDIQKVQEIRSYEQPTFIPSQPAFYKGIVNLRGVMVPILDLRVKFNLEYEYNDFTVVIVLNLDGKTTGVVADSVCDVITLKDNQIQKVDSIQNITNTDYLMGMGTLEDRMVQLINIEKFVLETENLQSL